MVDTKALLKGFGATADVAGQIATDKAINSRRTRSNFTQFDITNGQLLENVKLLDGDADGNPDPISHSLGRTPVGAIVLSTDSAAAVAYVSGSGTLSTITVTGTVNALATLWIV